MIRMPGQSYSGPLPPLSSREQARRDGLRRDVEKLGGAIGERNTVFHRHLIAAAEFIEAELRQAGYDIRRQEYEVAGKICRNLDAETKGVTRPAEIVIVGAHYDSVLGSPGANDNGSGVAALLALARAFAGKSAARTLRFVAFVNEEPPYFQTRAMGSMVYAGACRGRGEDIVAMISLETIGYYSDERGSQAYPFPLNFFYPGTGNFIAFVGNVSSRRLVRKAVESFRRHAPFPSEGAAVFGFIPGVGWSDHWSFWRHGYPAIMATDTAPYRYPFYHSAGDTPDQIDYDRLARVVSGLEAVVADLADGE